MAASNQLFFFFLLLDKSFITDARCFCAVFVCDDTCESLINHQTRYCNAITSLSVTYLHVYKLDLKVALAQM